MFPDYNGLSFSSFNFNYSGTYASDEFLLEEENQENPFAQTNFNTFMNHTSGNHTPMNTPVSNTPMNFNTTPMNFNTNTNDARMNFNTITNNAPVNFNTNTNDAHMKFNRPNSITLPSGRKKTLSNLEKKIEKKEKDKIYKQKIRHARKEKLNEIKNKQQDYILNIRLLEKQKCFLLGTCCTLLSTNPDRFLLDEITLLYNETFNTTSFSNSKIEKPTSYLIDETTNVDETTNARKLRKEREKFESAENELKSLQIQHKNLNNEILRIQDIKTLLMRTSLTGNKDIS